MLIIRMHWFTSLLMITIIGWNAISMVPVAHAMPQTVAGQVGQPVPTPVPEQAGSNTRNRNLLVGIAMGVALFSSSLALGIAVGIRRRIDRIAGPLPDEDE